MPAGPFFFHSAYPVTAPRVFPNFHAGAGSGSKHEEGLGVEASLGADAIWRLRCQMPSSIAGLGTPKLRVKLLANATSGSIRLNPKWASVAVGEDPSSATLQAEGTTPDARAGNAGTPGAGDTTTWGTGDNDQYLSVDWNLNADTVVAGEMIVMDLVAETSGWTLAQVLTMIPFIVFE